MGGSLISKKMQIFVALQCVANLIKGFIDFGIVGSVAETYNSQPKARIYRFSKCRLWVLER